MDIATLGYTPTNHDGRDLSFAPVANPLPKRLTQTQIAHYNEHGYVKPLPIFSPTKADQNRAYFDHLLAEMRQMKDGRDGNYAINAYHVCCEGLWDLVTHPAILDHVEDILGPNIVAWGSHFFSKQPRDPKHVPWHQDASYWPFTPARTVTVWLAIDDADENNAAMPFLPGTHTLGPLEWKQIDKAAVLGQEIVGAETFGPPVFDTLRAGEMSLHADMLAHGSTPNPSDRRRCGLTIRYCPPDHPVPRPVLDAPGRPLPRNGLDRTLDPQPAPRRRQPVAGQKARKHRRELRSTAITMNADVITDEQAAFYHENGYLVLPGALAPDRRPGSCPLAPRVGPVSAPPQWPLALAL